MSGDYGYYFEPPLDGRVPGHSALEIHVFSVPTERHFDPEHVTFPTASPEGTTSTISISHPWHGSDRLRVCAGHIVMQDRKRKTVQAYSFGGRADIAVEGDFSRCVVSSPAPILELVPTRYLDPEGIVTWLAAEVEALLARRRAAWIRTPETFGRRIATADPLALYIASLRAVRQGISARRPELRTDRERSAARMIDRALQAALEGRSAGATEPPRLEDIV